MKVILKATNGHSTKATAEQIKSSHKEASVSWDDQHVIVEYPQTEFGILLAEGLSSAAQKNKSFEVTLKE